jgi:hypothetical protein
MNERDQKRARQEFQRRLAAIDAETRKELEEMYAKVHRPRTDGGLDFTLDDYLEMTWSPGTEGLQRMANPTHLPFSFLLALRKALGVKDYMA